MANVINYLYDNEDVNHAPKEVVGLANSGVQKNELRRERNRKTLNENSKGIISEFGRIIPTRPTQTKLK